MCLRKPTDPNFLALLKLFYWHFQLEKHVSHSYFHTLGKLSFQYFNTLIQSYQNYFQMQKFNNYYFLPYEIDMAQSWEQSKGKKNPYLPTLPNFKNFPQTQLFFFQAQKIQDLFVHIRWSRHIWLVFCTFSWTQLDYWNCDWILEN